MLRHTLALGLLSFGVLQLQATRVAMAAPASPERAPSEPVSILELFTSEGCASCPPADALLRAVNGTQAPSGQRIIRISEHVTYWNRLGWTDPFSAEAFTNRQTTYAQRLSPEGPYTPQMVLNGREQFVGSDDAALHQAFEDDPHGRPVAVTIQQATLAGEDLVVHFALKGAAAGKPFDIVAVLTDDADRSNVRRGENSGRELEHVSVARELVQVASAQGDMERTVRIAVPPALRTDRAGHHLILFAQEPHQGAIVGGATVPLRP